MKTAIHTDKAREEIRAALNALRECARFLRSEVSELPQHGDVSDGWRYNSEEEQDELLNALHVRNALEGFALTFEQLADRLSHDTNNSRALER